MSLIHLPLSLFTITMGMAGYAISLRTFSIFGNMNVDFGSLPFYTATTIFITTILLIGIKSFKNPKTITHDWNDPLHINLFPTISISLLLLSIAGQSIAPICAFYCWISGTILHSIFSLIVIKSWIERTHFVLEHLNTLWFIPIVGNILVPIMGTQYGYTELSWFYFAIGISFWILLMPLIMYRLFFSEPLPQGLRPSLFILIAPPSAGFIAYHKLIHNLDGFAHVLIYLALFFFILNVLQALPKKFGKFSLSWWATVFPTAALITALLVLYHSTKSIFSIYLAATLLIGLTAWIIILLSKTIPFVWKLIIKNKT